jgi:superfamily II DNA or RNA helicase/HKD family nuclease
MSVLRTLREELRRCRAFTFSVAFVTPRAIALLKQELVDFQGTGRIITSDYLSFNSPEAFAELHNLGRLGIDVRIHDAKAFHPKGYIFEHDHTVTTMMGSSNLTENAIVRNHEWNLKVSAAPESDLARQLSDLVDRQLQDSSELTQQWIDKYRGSYVPPAPRPRRVPHAPNGSVETTDSDSDGAPIVPNGMQREALEAIAQVRDSGERRAMIVSTTGTGKTILSALDVRVTGPSRFLFVVHREQIIDRTINDYQRVLGGPLSDYGKLAGSSKETSRRYLFATVQSIAKHETLRQFPPDHFDHIVIDEAHRTGSESYRRLIEYFDPKFLMGMTATPERTDAFNVYELFDFNVAYEIRLNDALEAEMVSPFHYYGIQDVTYEDGTTTDALTDLRHLSSPERVRHLIESIEIYGQAGVPPRGLIFCSGKEEARSISDALNERTLRGRTLRTVALTGEDSVPYREDMVAKLERGNLDYILTVDVFNEGIDIPSINQVIMLRQTQSAIVFAQQLGRGLRKSPSKEYLVVIDFVGNYANNYIIPIALFGDDSLNKESLRQNLIAAEESGVLPGLSSIRFDRISQQRVLQSIASTKLDSAPRLKAAILEMRNRVGGTPRLWDFYRFKSVDPVVLATKAANYPALLTKVLKEDSGLSEAEHKALQLLSYEVLPSTRAHEFVLLRELLKDVRLPIRRVAEIFAAAGLPYSAEHVNSTIDTFTLECHAQPDQKRYEKGLAVREGTETVALTPSFAGSYSSSLRFAEEVDDIVRTGAALASSYTGRPFTPGRQYSRIEVCRILCWPRSWASTIYGYKVDRTSSMCPIFVTLHKSDEISTSTAYEDALLSPSSMLWYTRGRRTLQSDEIRPIIENEVALPVFVKKDDADGADFYYLGNATSRDAEQTTMPNGGSPQAVVRMHLEFDRPMESALFDYFHPTVTDPV